MCVLYQHQLKFKLSHALHVHGHSMVNKEREESLYIKTHTTTLFNCIRHFFVIRTLCFAIILAVCPVQRYCKLITLITYGEGDLLNGYKTGRF